MNFVPIMDTQDAFTRLIEKVCHQFFFNLNSIKAFNQMIFKNFFLFVVKLLNFGKKHFSFDLDQYFSSNSNKSPIFAQQFNQQISNLVVFNDPFCFLLIGYCYEFGFGITPNPSKAFDSYLKAISFQTSVALHRFGYCYLNGIGINKNESKAFEFFVRAAEMDYPPAISNIGYCHVNGIGINKMKKKDSSSLFEQQRIIHVQFPMLVIVIFME